jgi:hypothetical protein
MTKIMAAQRLLSEKTNQEKITHYSKMLQRVKHRLHQLDHDRAPKTTQRYLKWAVRLETRIHKLKSRHRH